MTGLVPWKPGGAANREILKMFTVHRGNMSDPLTGKVVL